MSYLVKEKWNQLFLQFEKTLQIFFKNGNRNCSKTEKITHEFKNANIYSIQTRKTMRTPLFKREDSREALVLISPFYSMNKN